MGLRLVVSDEGEGKRKTERDKVMRDILHLECEDGMYVIAEIYETTSQYRLLDQ